MDPSSAGNHTSDDSHLSALGYEENFSRSMSLWANLALGFTYLSPLVGVYSLFATGMTTGGAPSIWWLVIVAGGQLLVALVFGEVVSQYPISGGIYPWTRRLWGRRYAWIAAWVYICALIVTVTSVASYGSGFIASLFGLEPEKDVLLWLSLSLLALALALNFTGTKTLAKATQIGLAAELIGVLAVGIYLMIFQRKQPFSVFFDTMGLEGDGSYLPVFLGAALTGLFLFYGFEACGDVAEEVRDPARRIPQAMILTILVGGVSALVAFAGYVLAAPDLEVIISGEETNPIPEILVGSLGEVGAKVFLVIAITAFISCVLSLQAAASRLLFAFARDGMLPGHTWLARVSDRQKVPVNSLLVACVVPALLCVLIYLGSEQLLNHITAFAIIGIYLGFQMVVLAALRQRLRGWKPAGPFTLGRVGIVVNVAALLYGVFAMVLLAWPDEGDFLDRWIVLIGLGVVLGFGLLYLFVMHPDRHSNQPAGDALEIATKLRTMRGSTSQPAADDENVSGRP